MYKPDRIGFDVLVRLHDDYYIDYQLHHRRGLYCHHQLHFPLLDNGGPIALTFRNFLAI